jgi:broad specificity phosphatase PhoE
MTTADWPEWIMLVRHAQSVANVADDEAHARGAGKLELAARDADIDLSPTGRHQAAALGRWLADQPETDQPTAVICSPYERTVQTANAVITESGLNVPVRRDERIRERELGWIDGFTSRGIRERFPEEAERRRWVGKFYYRPPGGESWCDVALRIRSFLQSLQQEYAGARVMITTHQAVIMNFRYVLEGLTEAEILEIDGGERLGNCSVTRYCRQADGSLALERFNDVEPIRSSAEPVTKEEPVADARQSAESS